MGWEHLPHRRLAALLFGARPPDLGLGDRRGLRVCRSAEELVGEADRDPVARDPVAHDLVNLVREFEVVRGVGWAEG
jgi:hypothetical protein